MITLAMAMDRGPRTEERGPEPGQLSSFDSQLGFVGPFSGIILGGGIEGTARGAMRFCAGL